MGVQLRVRFLSPACLLQDASSGWCATRIVPWDTVDPRCTSPHKWRSGCLAFNSLPPSVHPQSASNAAAGSQRVIGRCRWLFQNSSVHTQTTHTQVSQRPLALSCLVLSWSYLYLRVSPVLFWRVLSVPHFRPPAACKSSLRTKDLVARAVPLTSGALSEATSYARRCCGFQGRICPTARRFLHPQVRAVQSLWQNE